MFNFTCKIFKKIYFQKFGVTEAEVQEALLLNDRHDQLVIAYHLIIDNKRIWNEGMFFPSLIFFIE